MKVLIIGRGVIGTVYGWTLSGAGVDVTHVVRRTDLPATDTLEVLDLRPGHTKRARAVYTPKTVERISRSDGFNLMIVATKHYQAVEALRQYLPEAGDATILLFTANWEGTEEIDRILPRTSAIWGYAKSSGGVDARGVHVVTVDPAVRLGTLEGFDPARFKAAGELFRQAGFTLDVKPNIIEWLWVHHAINGGGIGVCLWAGGIAEATRNPRTVALGVRAVREALAVVAARGVNLEGHPEARSILRSPTSLAWIAVFAGIRLTEKGRRLLRTSHFSNSAEEMKRFYFDVLNTGERLGVAMPNLATLRERIEAYPAGPGAG